MAEVDNKEPSENKLTVALPFEWAIQKVLGPTLGEIGSDIAKLYKKGRDKIVQAAARKVKPGTEDHKANLRVAWNTLSSGAFSDSAIGAEYFGGLLASSKSEKGEDDSGVYYLDIINSLSSSQLHLHYCVYRAFNHLLSSRPDFKELNLGRHSAIADKSIHFFSTELMWLGIKSDIDCGALSSKGLVGKFNASQTDVFNPRTREISTIPYTLFTPTSLGFQLYAVAHSQLEDWKELTHKILDDFPDIKYPIHFQLSLENLAACKFGINKLNIEIYATPEEVFNYLLNPQNTPKWQLEIKSARHGFPVDVGSVFELTADGQNWFKSICIEFEKNTAIAFQNEDASFNNRWEFTNISENKTLVTYTEWVTEGARLFDPLDFSTLERLKQLIEMPATTSLSL